MVLDKAPAFLPAAAEPLQGRRESLQRLHVYRILRKVRKRQPHMVRMMTLMRFRESHPSQKIE